MGKREEKSMKKPKVLRLRPDGPMKEVLEGSASMKHALLDKMSIALFKVPKGKWQPDSRAFPPTRGRDRNPVEGTAKVFAGGEEYVVKEGEAIIIPAGVEHTGIFSDDEECWLLAIASPPRTDYGPPNW